MKFFAPTVIKVTLFCGLICDYNLFIFEFMPPTSSQPNVLLIRLSAIGDIVMASGLPSSIKTALPNAKVTWLVEQPYVGLVQHHPFVDEVISWPKNEWRALGKKRAYWSLVKSILAFRKQLRARGFTHAIDAQGLLKSAFLAFLSGAKNRIGFNSKEHSQRFLTNAIDKPISDQISSEYRFLSAHLGATSYALNIEMGEQATLQLRQTLQVMSVKGEYIVLAPFTTRPQKHWPIAHWKQLITLIRQHCSYPIVILGGPTDSCDAQSLTFDTSDVYSLAGHATLSESAVAVKQSRAFIGVDTGLTHMAVAYVLPTIALFGSTCPYTYTDNDNTHVLYKDLACAPCKRKPSCNGAFDCMALISPEAVFNTVKEYL
ncbi:glycosyltransferase family 9 protein [Alteromonas sp. 1_MG-2023]|uniref:glycosyltransferase family 9 protein n=1 Tax=Alteromonas sp. 1_MG-2023 TaxID=3062669 RepID=UPI0026E4911D|nr:glycosyltransferase family 9 protein [Alteromonas sp. 1_MG-2023]MDO6567787.1 glycosyltransferase family 9 protein [Alteromonas sp. 1_MG-2023]